MSEDTKSFADLGTSSAVVNALSEQGITAPFAIQAKVIADVLAGRDVLARSPTGSGKTLAFGIPMVDRITAEGPRPSALILAPTRELATQIVAELKPIAHSRALRITAVYGGVGLQKQGKDAAQSHIIVATPGRLEDQLQRRAFKLDAVRVLILDEADRMLDMGFKPAVDRINALCRRADRQTLFFSATLDGEAGRAARAYTTNPAEHESGPVERRANDQIEHRFIETAHENRVDALVEQLGASDRELSLVFVRTKRGADRLVKRLDDHGVKSVAMHGDKSQRQRERALAQFENWDVDVLVATDVAARGIDVNGISHVINFDPPDDSETYVHRVGRTGRAGAKGIGVTLLSPDQRRDVARMASDLGIEHQISGGGGGGGASREKAPAHASQGPRRQRPPRAGGNPRGESRGGQNRGDSRNGSNAGGQSRGESRTGANAPRGESRGGANGSRSDSRGGANQPRGEYRGGGNRPARTR